VIAEGVRDTDLGAYQRAARTVLVHPLVTRTHPNADALAMVRRFAIPLARDLDAVAGYRLELSPTCARLVKRTDRLDPTQAIQLPQKKPFGRRRYAYLSLVLGALGRAATQVALTEVADALRRRAAEIDGLGFDPDEWRHRLAFVDVTLHLERLGVLTPLEVTGVSWLKDPEVGDALYDVDREAVHALFVPPRVVEHVGSVTALLVGEMSASRDARRAASRQRLARQLLEHPVVYLDDLPEGDRLYLRNQARPLAADLERLTGGQVERRSEGIALIDATGGFSDGHRFPTGGTPAQVALLLADAAADAVAGASAGDAGWPGVGIATVPTAADLGAELAARLDAARPDRPALVDPWEAPVAGGGAAPDSSAEPATVESPSAPAPDRGQTGADDTDAGSARGPLLTDAWLDHTIAGLVASHGRAFSADLRDDDAALRTAAVGVLTAFDLVRPVPGGVVALPAISRFRDVRVETAPSPQLSLLDNGGGR
jgi:uncharacterized protein (TIGR02678 family)